MRAIAFILTTLFLVSQAEAKSARCFTTDDGYYPCNFRTEDSSGSFTISAANKPTFTLWIESRGVASAIADFGTGRYVTLPGMYYRSKQDGACWVNSSTNTQICAW